MRPNVKRGFNRLFIVLTLGWFVYCSFVYPTQKRLQAQKTYEGELQDCYEHKLGEGQEFKECLEFAEAKSGVDD